MAPGDELSETSPNECESDPDCPLHKFMNVNVFALPSMTIANIPFEGGGPGQGLPQTCRVTPTSAAQEMRL